MDVGAHVSVAGGVDNAVDRLLDVGGNCGQIFTTSPQVWQLPSIDEDEINSFAEQTEEAAVGPWIIHSAYLVNLATPKRELREKSIESLQAELDAAATLNVEYVNVHPGAHTGAGVEAGLANTVSAIESLSIPDSVTLLIETDAGSGTKLGGSFGHLAYILSESEQDLGVCFDTAHAFAAGYDLSTPNAVDETIAAFDDTVGLQYLDIIHLNDSKHPCDSNRDEHAHIGTGEIGEEGMSAFINHETLRNVPFVLETPTEDGRGFAWNIERVKTLSGG